MDKLYICIDDDNTQWVKGMKMTIKEWCDLANTWEDNDGMEELTDFGDNPTIEDLKYIGSVWLLKFEEVYQ